MKKKDILKSKQEQIAELQREQFKRSTLSFYRYVQIKNPSKMRDFLHEKLFDFGCKGRIYVAKEGINAQMNVPEHNWDEFNTFIQSQPEFNGVPYKFAVEEDSKSFVKLIVKHKQKIVADGLDDSTFDASDTGTYLTAAEMNAYIENPDAVVVDMRNAYESEVGHFKNAITPDVDTFREELKVVVDQLADKKDAPIALYCTGGIRCEKASAWMKHNGFKNVHHLRGGIIDYAHQVQEQGLPNKFKGKNFVFDERLGERISDDIISFCHLCTAEKSDTHYHCKNQFCHVLYLGCKSCVKTKKGYCSVWCRGYDLLPIRLQKFLAKLRKDENKAQFKKNRLKLKH